MDLYGSLAEVSGEERVRSCLIALVIDNSFGESFCQDVCYRTEDGEVLFDKEVLSRSEPLVGELMLCHEEERRGSYLELGTEAKYRHGAWARAQ